MKKYMSLSLVLVLSLISLFSFSQKEITHEDMWYFGKFYPRTVHGFTSMNDGEHFTSLNQLTKTIDKFSYKTGEKIETLLSVKSLKNESIEGIDEYNFDAKEEKILFSTNIEAIYRHSFKADYYIYDIASESLKKLSNNGKQQLASFSPDGSKIAFVRDNNLFYTVLKTGAEIQVTKDGEWNKIINGAPDWVYEEEFSFSKAYEWSPDSKNIAYLKTDETDVKEFSFTTYGELYTGEYKYKYPKAGEENSRVNAFIYNLETKQSLIADIGDMYNNYIPRFKWTNTENMLAIIKLNRLQNNYNLFMVNAQDGTAKSVLNLTDEKYIEIHDDLFFSEDGENFILTNETDGFRHIYLYDINGKMLNQITKGEHEITDVYGYDSENSTVYYQACESSPLNREIFSIKTNGSSKKQLSKKEGTNSAEFSDGFKYYINTYSTANTPYYISLNNNKGKEIRVIEDNKNLQDLMNDEYQFVEKEFLNFDTESGVNLNAWIIKPNDFKEKNEYPVLMYEYGGPGSQKVLNDWDYNLAWWQMLAQKGYIVICVDNRGTGGRGKEFRQVTYKTLGKYEAQDQIEAAKYFGKLKYIDANRIGIFGWSYGGYLSTLCMTKGADVFKTGIAVAPVATWKYYDSIYTERYNGLPQDNEAGYNDYSPINHLDKLKGNYLLVHGTSDDNVHFQNSVDMVTELVRQNIKFDVMYYPNSNHGIYHDNARIHLYTKMTDFILEKL